MRQLIPKFFFAFLILSSSIFGGNPFKKTGIHKSENIVFIENKGQVSDQFGMQRPDILFSGFSNGLAFYLKTNGISYQLNKVVSWKNEENKILQKIKSVPEKISTYRIDVSWINTNVTTLISKGTVLPGFNNY